MASPAPVVTVFGGSGFIGRHLVRRLAKTGAVVRVASRHPSQSAYLKTAGAVGQIVPLAVDVTDDASITAAVQGAGWVVNLIGILYESGRWTFERAHVEAPDRIARAAAAAGVGRLVHVSAIGAHSDAKPAYARTKAAGEAAVRAAVPEAVILRPSIIFGPEDSFFNLFAGMALVAPALPLIGGGHTRFQPVYVGDIAEAIQTVLTDPATKGKTYELGGPRIYSFKELLQLMLSEIGRKRLLVTVPWKLAELQGTVLQRLPKPPLTRDQVELLRSDNVVAEGALTLRDLGITPTAAEIILPTYLDRFRPGGRFNRQREA